MHLKLQDVHDPEVGELLSGKGIEAIKDSLKFKKRISSMINPEPATEIYQKPQIHYLSRRLHKSTQKVRIPEQTTGLMEKLKKAVEESKTDRNRCQSQENEVFLKKGYQTQRT